MLLESPANSRDADEELAPITAVDVEQVRGILDTIANGLNSSDAGFVPVPAVLAGRLADGTEVPGRP